MTSRTHDLFAFASLISVATYYPPVSINASTMIISTIGCVIGSLLPDIDQESNKLWDLLPVGHFLGSFLKNIFLAHRTLSHSIIGIIAFYEAFNWLLPKILNSNSIHIHAVFVALMVGYISHLVADSLTEEGIPLFFPFKFKIGFPPIKALRIRTGSFVEKYIFFPSILIYIIWFVSSNDQKILEIIKLAIKS